MLPSFRIEILLSGGTKHSVIGNNLLGLFLKRKCKFFVSKTITLIKRRLIGVKTHPDKHI